MSANPFIYFSGDSYMAGSELADDTLPSWGGYVTHDWIQAETFADRKIRITKYKEELAAMTREQTITFNNTIRARHWTTIVCDKHGIKHYNDGLSGSSQESVLHRAILAFDKFERDGNVPTLAIIQLTSPCRVTVYDDKPMSRKAHHIFYRTQMNEQFGFDKSFVLNFSPHMTGVAGQYLLAHMDVESETGNIIRWLTTLAITNSFFKEKTGRYPIYLSSLAPHIKNYTSPMEDFFANNTAKTTETTGYASLLHQARLHTVNPDIWNLAHDAHLRCPGGHHSPQTHANFAQFIAPHLLQELNNVS